MLDTARVKRFAENNPDAPILPESLSVFRRLQRGLTNMYRDVLYTFLQRFVYHGQMVFFGSILNPVGCAVAYRRKYIEALFDHYEPTLGDDLTNSEDIFIGFALVNQGYRNIQLTDVCARSEEPEAHVLPRQLYMWSSSFMQSCYYFDNLLRSPFKSLKRHRQRKRVIKSGVVEKRNIREQYRQPFGLEYTKEYGRPLGWVVLMSALEKISFPTIVLIMIVCRWWEALGITLLAETVLAVGILMLITKGRRLEYLLKGILISPMRYLAVLFDFVTAVRFFSDLWIFRSRNWRK